MPTTTIHDLEPTRERLSIIAEALDKAFNGTLHGEDRVTGFVLLTFPIGAVDDPRCNYTSNGVDRKEMVAMFKELVARFEGQPELRGRA